MFPAGPIAQPLPPSFAAAPCSRRRGLDSLSRQRLVLQLYNYTAVDIRT
jgi:hypothetical protein